MKKYKHINVELLLEISDGNKELITDLADMYLTQAPKFEQQLDELYQNNDFESLGKLAHKIKGSVSTLGMKDLAAMLKELETDAKQGVNQENFPELINYYKITSKEATNELNELLKEL